MGVFSRSWEITKISFDVVKKDKEMLIFPLLSSIFSLLYSAALLIPNILLVLLENMENYENFGAFEYLIVFLTYLGLAFIATFFNVCVVYTTKIRFDGGNATFGDSFKFAFSKIHLIFMWSLLSATVGLLLYILDQIGQKLGGIGKIIVLIIRSVIAMAWNIVTIFVIPGLVYYNLSPFKAIKKSTETLQKTWGESLVRHFGMGLIQGLFLIIGVIISVAIGFLLYPLIEMYAILLAIGVGLLYIIIIILVFGIANSVYNTALFVYADTGAIPSGYNDNIMSNAFKEKKKKKSKV